MLSILFDEKTGQFSVSDQSTQSILRNGHMGEKAHETLVLGTEEGMYAIDARGAECLSLQTRKGLSFNDIAKRLAGRHKLIAKYYTYRDWRERGLMLCYPNSAPAGEEHQQQKKYPAAQSRIKVSNLIGVFFQDDLTTTVDDKEKGRSLYEESWMGQYGSYKRGDKGAVNKLDIHETLFLMELGKLRVENASRSEIIGAALERSKEFEKLYDVYKDWRCRGYVVKTGFKFGTHFRIYFPGAKPQSSGDERTHSKHVIHVFPRDAKLLTSELARAIRVAHSVRKTFILAIPGKSRRKSAGIDFVLYYRKDNNAQLPGKDRPSYGMLSLGEDEYVGGAELSSATEDAMERKLELIVAIADRETAVTYYRVRRIGLQGSNFEYYEIDWMQP